LRITFFVVSLPSQTNINTAMDKHLDFFNYDGCLIHYEGRIQNIRQAKMYGEESIAKPILLLAIIDSITDGEIVINQIRLTEELIERYGKLMKTYAKNLEYYSKTPIYNPFWHLQGDSFWHLYGAECIKEQKNTPSVPWIQEHVLYASVDEPLWILLQNESMRLQLRDYIIEHKLTDDFSNGKKIVEGLGVLAAILLAA
jgi:putative restriction endonuclease